MLLLISPAKTLDYKTAPVTSKYTQPLFLDDAQELIDSLMTLSPQDIAKLMKVSDKIAALNATRFAEWSQPFTQDNAKQSILAFKGDVYTGLDAESFSETDFNYAQMHLRILSGLYGLLRPLDLMQPYRLEMGTKYENASGKNLYEFWGNKITERLNHELTDVGGSRVLVNLASNEYFHAVNNKVLDAQIITPVFKDFKNDKYKIISFYAKKARGMMSAYAVDNKVTQVQQLKDFSKGGYYFSEEQSSATEWVFLRDKFD